MMFVGCGLLFCLSFVVCGLWFGDCLCLLFMFVVYVCGLCLLCVVCSCTVFAVC